MKTPVSRKGAKHARLAKIGKNSAALSHITLDNPLAPLGERVASVASRVRGSADTQA